MDGQKHIDILKKRNIALSNELEDAKQKIQELKDKDITNTDNQKVQSLISELEDLKQQFIETIEDLDKAKLRYDALNKELIEIKKNFQIFRIPWYRKVFEERG